MVYVLTGVVVVCFVVVAILLHRQVKLITALHENLNRVAASQAGDMADMEKQVRKVASTVKDVEEKVLDNLSDLRLKVQEGFDTLTERTDGLRQTVDELCNELQTQASDNESVSEASPIEIVIRDPNDDTDENPGKTQRKKPERRGFFA